MESLGILGNVKYSFIAINFKNILDMTLNHLMERLPSWNFGKCEVLLHCH